MSNSLLRNNSVVKDYLRKDLPKFLVGSVVTVYYKIVEGNKERIQPFKGIVTNIHACKDTTNSQSLDASFTVLRVGTAAIKIERVFALHSSKIDRIEVHKLRRARRSNLRYLRAIKDPINQVRAKIIQQKLTQESAV